MTITALFSPHTGNTSSYHFIITQNSHRDNKIPLMAGPSKSLFSVIQARKRTSVVEFRWFFRERSPRKNHLNSPDGSCKFAISWLSLERTIHCVSVHRILPGEPAEREPSMDDMQLNRVMRHR